MGLFFKPKFRFFAKKFWSQNSIAKFRSQTFDHKKNRFLAKISIAKKSILGPNFDRKKFDSWSKFRSQKIDSLPKFRSQKTSIFAQISIAKNIYFFPNFDRNLQKTSIFGQKFDSKNINFWAKFRIFQNK